MSVRTLFILGLALFAMMLGGCATIERHPIISGIVVGSIAVSIATNQHHDRLQPEVIRLPQRPGEPVSPDNGGH